MFSAQSFSAVGKPTDDKGVFISVAHDFFFMCLSPKKNAEEILDTLQNLSNKNTIKELQNHLPRLEKRDNYFSGLVVAKIVDNIFYAGISGNMYLMLKREGEIHPLFKPTKMFKTLSGFIKQDDIFVFATPEGKQLIDKNSISENLDQDAAGLSGKIDSLKNQEETGLLFIRFTKTPLNLPQIKLPSASLMQIVLPVLSFFTKINRKLIKIVLGALALILVGIVVYNTINRVIKTGKEKVATEMKKIEEMQNGLNSAQELLNLNNVRSRTIAAQTLSEIKKIDLTKLVSQDNKKKIEDIKTQLETTLKEASNIVQSKAELVYSTTLLKKNSSASEIIMSNNNLVILDEAQNLVYAINLDSKKANVFDLSKLGKNPKYLAGSQGMIFVFYSEAIVQIDTATNKIKTVLKKDSEWKKIVNLESYAENLYLLDTDAGQIWKYIREDGGYSLVKPYFSKNGVLKNAVSFAIDSAVYVAFDNGGVKKYLSGEEVTDKWQFDPKKLPEKQLVSPAKILTNENLSNVYILEPINKRVVILNKEGKYQKQIIDGKLAGAKTLGVNEKDKKIYFSVGSEIYAIQM